MTALNFAIFLTLACWLGVLAQLLIPAQTRWHGRGVSKVLASACFVGVALAVGDMGSTHGQLVFLALALSCLGDAFLVSVRHKIFLIGIAVFLAAHVFYSAAFFRGPTSWLALGNAVAVSVVVGWLTMRWLAPHLSGVFKVAVPVYVVVILLMCIAASSYAAAHEHWQVLWGVVLFALSDLTVARERFICNDFKNDIVGLPLYYAAQLLLAWSLF